MAANPGNVGAVGVVPPAMAPPPAPSAGVAAAQPNYSARGMYTGDILFVRFPSRAGQRTWDEGVLGHHLTDTKWWAFDEYGEDARLDCSPTREIKEMDVPDNRSYSTGVTRNIPNCQERTDLYLYGCRCPEADPGL